MSSYLKRYSFINAKLKTRTDFLLDEAFFRRLEDRPNLNEAMILLKDTVYGVMHASYEQTGDLKMAEKELRLKEIGFYRELKRHGDELLSGFLDVLLLKFDVEVLKEWIRLWYDSRVRGRDVSVLSPYMIREKVVEDFEHDTLLNCSDPQALYEHLARGVYKGLFTALRERAEPLESLYDLEKSLDRLRFARVLAYADAFPPADADVIRRITGMEIDFENMLSLLRMGDVLPAGKLLDDLIDGGPQLNRDGLGRTKGDGDDSRKSEAEKSREIVGSALASYGGMGSLLLKEESGREDKLAMVEAVLRELEKREADRLMRGSPFSIGIMLSYFMRKEREAARLVRILNDLQYRSDGSSGHRGMS